MATKAPTTPTTTPATAPATGAPSLDANIGDAAANARAQIDKGIATARQQAGPLAEKAKQFAKDRPWTAAALVGSIAVAVMGSLKRGKL